MVYGRCRSLKTLLFSSGMSDSVLVLTFYLFLSDLSFFFLKKKVCFDKNLIVSPLKLQTFRRTLKLESCDTQYLPCDPPP